MNVRLPAYNAAVRSILIDPTGGIALPKVLAPIVMAYFEFR